MPRAPAQAKPQAKAPPSLAALAERYEAARTAWQAHDRARDEAQDDRLWAVNDKAAEAFSRALRKARHHSEAKAFHHSGAAYYAPTVCTQHLCPVVRVGPPSAAQQAWRGPRRGGRKPKMTRKDMV